MQNSDVTIIGGGVMGLMTARECLNAGLTVTLLEKNRCGQESSWAGGGILSPLYPWRQAKAINELMLPSIRSYPKLASELFASTGIDTEWTRSGLLVIQNEDLDLAIEWSKESNINVEKPDTALFSKLNANSESALFFPEIAQVRNPRLLQALQKDVLNKGIQFIENCEIRSIDCEQQKVRFIQSSLEKIPVNKLVVTTGAWTKSMFHQFFVSLSNVPNIYPAKGQMLLFDAPPQTLNTIILENDSYLIPRRDGKILAGSTVEPETFDKALTSTAYEKLHTFATTLCPELTKYPVIKHWAGIRPATNEGIPYICKHPEISNLYLNSGHFRNGLTMAPASAKLLVDLMLNRQFNVNPTPYQFT